MFYEIQSENSKNEYKKILKIVGSISRLFSDSETPYLYYRAHENIFARCFDAVNNSRSDDTADAYKDNIGVGLKTWVGGDNQKIAEFGKLRPQYENLRGLELIKSISFFRNERIRVTKNLHGLDKMIYHVVKRIPKTMQIFEALMQPIDIKNISIIKNRGGENTIYFTDKIHTYNFSLSKNTLYMVFDDLELLDSFEVEIIEDPYEMLKKINKKDVSQVLPSKAQTLKQIHQQLCLRLYTINKSTKEKTVELKSGLNQWNGIRTANITKKDSSIKHVEKQRNPNELYIPYPVEDQRRIENFFPLDENGDFARWTLILPNGNKLFAKRCQSGGKGIMSDPNSDLGKWLLRDVLELPEGTVVTYEMLQRFNIDSVIFTKLADDIFSIDFCELGTYEKFYGLDEN